eukprot:gb/GECG01007898.1/.p1 GENE.gb/GECG01007898.1/~~gb/GECG01007898.1/.p1  ORF type:complete len:288 (+),score=35.67 gb/GECG01007898.1/:1-864(+)
MKSSFNSFSTAMKWVKNGLQSHSTSPGGKLLSNVHVFTFVSTSVCGSRTSLVLKNAYHSALRKFRRATGKETPEPTEMFRFFAREFPLCSRKSSPQEAICKSAETGSHQNTSSGNKEVDLAFPFAEQLRGPEQPQPSLPCFDENDMTLAGSNLDQNALSPMYGAEPPLPSFSLYDEPSDNLQRTENLFQGFESKGPNVVDTTVTATEIESASLVRSGSGSSGAETIHPGGTFRDTTSCEGERHMSSQGATINIVETSAGESFPSFLFPEDWFEIIGGELCTDFVADE